MVRLQDIFLRTFIILFSFIFATTFAHAYTEIQSVKSLIESGRLEEAYQEIEKIISIDPGNPDAFYLLVTVYLLKVDEEKAQVIIEKSVSPDKQSMLHEADAYLWAGRILIKEREQAHIGLHYISKASALSPEKVSLAVPLLKEGGMSLASDKPWLAHRILDKASLLDPSLLQNDAFFYAHSIQTIADPREKIRAAEKFILQFPDSPILPEVLLQKGESLYMLGDFPEVKAVYQKISEEYPGSSPGKEAAKRLASFKEFHRTAVTVLPGLTPVKTGVFLEKGGQFSIGASGHSISGPFSQGPDGRRGVKGATGDILPYSSALPMALIAKIGDDGQWFLVGSGFVGTADRQGNIYLMMNRPLNHEKDSVDYKGFYSVMIQSERSGR